MGATLATVDPILKEVYEGRLEDQLNREVITLKRIERSDSGVTNTVGGKYVDFPIRVEGNAGIGGRAEGAALPTAGQQKYASVHVPLKYLYARGNITAQTMRLAEKNYQAFASALDMEMEGLKNDFQKDLARQVYGNGSGALANVVTGGIAGITSVTVDNVQYLEIGFTFEFGLTASPYTLLATGGPHTITDINETTKVVTFTPATTTNTVANTHSLYRPGSQGNEITGFKSIVAATGTLHNVNPSTYPVWKAIVKDNAGTNRALSEGLMIETADAVKAKGGKTTVIFTSLGVRRAYFNLLTQQRRYADTKEFAGGFQGLAFNHGKELPVVEDTDAPPNRMWFVNEDELKVYRESPVHFADDEGHVLKHISGYDMFEFYLRLFQELGTSRRNTHALLADITEG